MDVPKNSLLRFVSRDLPIETKVETVGEDMYVVLVCQETEIGRRRLNKRSCCHSDSPCIGPILIEERFRKRFGIPAFIHVSICYDELVAARSASP